MNKPQLRDDMIGEGRKIYAVQDGRIVFFKDSDGNAFSYFDLTKLEKQRFDDFQWRLDNAWKRYDEAQG